eukprot:802421-Prymnesium_polylepis.1
MTHTTVWSDKFFSGTAQAVHDCDWERGGQRRRQEGEAAGDGDGGTAECVLRALRLQRGDEADGAQGHNHRPRPAPGGGQ